MRFDVQFMRVFYLFIYLFFSYYYLVTSFYTSKMAQRQVYGVFFLFAINFDSVFVHYFCSVRSLATSIYQKACFWWTVRTPFPCPATSHRV
jgi:hypothetical protein